MGQGAEQLFSRERRFVDGCYQMAGRLQAQVRMKLQTVETHRTRAVQFQGMRLHIQVEIQFPFVQVDALRRQPTVEHGQSVHFRFPGQDQFSVLPLLGEAQVETIENTSAPSLRRM